MLRSCLRPAWALVLAGLFAVAVSPDAAFAQRRAVRISSVDMTPPDAAATVGQTVVFTPNAYDASNNPVATAVFACSSNNERVATVDANCIATGRAPGTVIITARTGTGATAKSATATLTVSPAGLVEQQGARQPQPQPQPTQPQPQPDPSRPAGSIGLAAYECQPDGTGSAAGLTLSPLRVILARGESRQLNCRAVRSDGETAARVPIVFSVLAGGERVIAVDSVGFIRASGDTGRATVKAEVPGNVVIQPRQVAVEVRADTVRFAESELLLSPGAVDTLAIEIPAQDRVFNVRGEFQFTSSDDAKVRVAPLHPILTALAPGTARITAESPYFSFSTTVTVHRRVLRFGSLPARDTLTLAVAARQRLVVRALGEDTTAPITDAPLRWTLPDTAVARFDTATGIVTGLRSGMARLAVAAPYSRDSLVSRAWAVRVVSGALSASRTRVGLGVGERSPLAVQLLDDRRQPIGPAEDLRWASSADSIARYADGNIQGAGVGRARLTARGATWDSTVTVDVFVVGPLLVPARKAGRWDLYAMTPDSAPRFTAITADSAAEEEPAWGPDLTRIAFTIPAPERPSNQDLYVANADGTERRRLTNDSATVASPVFVRPTGGSIVFRSNKGGREQLHMVNTDGTGRRQLTSGEAPSKAPDVSMDGRRLLFVSQRQLPGSSRNWEVWEMRLDSVSERRLTVSPQNEDMPQYASDGRSFYFLRNEGGRPPTVRLYRQSLTDSLPVAQALTPVGMNVTGYSVAVDGSQIVLATRERVGGSDVTRVLLLNTAAGTTTIVQPGAAVDELLAPVFRPATPQPR